MSLVLIAGFMVLLLAFAWGFAGQLWSARRTRTIRFPLSLFAAEEFERDGAPAAFWGVAALDGLVALLALSAAAYLAWILFPVARRPVDDLHTLDGCYEGEGLPDFMRPPVHWAFRLSNGTLFDRAGRPVSTIRLAGRTKAFTRVTFAPGIVVSSDEHKRSAVYAGDTVAGQAYLSGGQVRLALDDDWPDLMLKTSCGVP